MRKLLIILFCFISISLRSATYYVATTGNDAAAGTISAPWATWQKGFSTAEAGDTVYFRGGVWMASDDVGNNIVNMQARDYGNILPFAGHIGHDGTEGDPIVFMAYPGETPILDCSDVYADNPANGYITGINIQWTNYITLKGLTIRNIYDRNEYVHCNGISISGGSNYTLENITIHDVDGEAMYIGLGGGYTTWNIDYNEGEVGSGIDTDTTRVINCDIYDCWNHSDLGSGIGGWADGVKATNPSVPDYDGYLLFDSCRVWNCSDDALDPGGAGLIEVRNCWLFANGHLAGGDGCGIKTGPSSSGYMATFISRKIYRNLFAWGSYGVAMIEYPNYARMPARIMNNTFYKNEVGVGMIDNEQTETGKTFLYNNIFYKSTTTDAGGRPNYISGNSLAYFMTSHNNIRYGLYGSLPPWLYNDTITVTDADFLLTAESEADSITAYAQLTAARVNGKLPEITFMKLAAGSDLIDYGIQTPATDSSGITLVYSGASPDLGFAEYEVSVPATSTASVSLIKSIQALISGNVISDGDATITARGIVWGTSENPTTSNNVVTVSGTTGSYTTTLTGLTSNTTYHVRSYATNSAGTSYGADVSFTTKEYTPVTNGSIILMVGGKQVVIK